MKKDKHIFMEVLKRMPTLFFGLFLYAAAILATVYSNFGVGPWDVFHLGMVKNTGLTLGQVSELTGFIVLIISYFIGVTPGLGSVFNMIFIGVFIDLLEMLNLYHIPSSMPGRIVLLIAGIITMGWASYFYLRANLGAGPRDSLMEGLVKKLNKPVWLIRGAIEIAALVIGYFLGGPVGLGTLIISFTIGFSVQVAFKLGRYDSKSVEHMDLVQMYRSLRE